MHVMLQYTDLKILWADVILISGLMDALSECVMMRVDEMYSGDNCVYQNLNWLSHSIADCFLKNAKSFYIMYRSC